MLEISPLALYSGLLGSLIFLSFGEVMVRFMRSSWRFACRYDTRLVVSVLTGAYFAPMIADNAPMVFEKSVKLYSEMVEEDGVQRSLSRLLSRHFNG